ncbi:MAG: hypothetical protein AB8D78_12565 [Akkermansiaceae bacterium]
MKLRFAIGAGIVGFLVLAGCADRTNEIPEVTEKMAMEYGVDQASLMRGRETYMAHCSKCHEHVKPGEIDPEFWPSVTAHMGVKAELDDKQEEELLHYLMLANATVHGMNPEH